MVGFAFLLLFSLGFLFLLFLREDLLSSKIPGRRHCERAATAPSGLTFSSPCNISNECGGHPSQDLVLTQRDSVEAG